MSEYNEHKEWSMYIKLLDERPQLFKSDSSSKGALEIITDFSQVRDFENKTGIKIGVVYKSPWRMMVVDLVKSVSGKMFAYERIIPTTPSGGTVIIPVYNNNFVLIKQYRHALRREQWAFPRGFGEMGLNAFENAKKELREEIHAEALSCEELGTTLADSGLSGEEIKVFCCEIKDFGFDSGYEGITNVAAFSLDELKNMIRDRKLDDGFTLAALALYITTKTTDYFF